MDRMSPGPGSRGLTLIELMITLAIAALVLALGGPSMQALVQGTQLRAESNRLVSAINLARSESINSNLPVSLCPAPMASDGSAECSGNYARGWMVFSNPGSDGSFDVEVDRVIRAYGPLPAGYTLTNRSGTRALSEPITYLPDGSSRRNRTLLVCAPAGWKTAPSSVVLNRVGRARVARGEGLCPVPVS